MVFLHIHTYTHTQARTQKRNPNVRKQVLAFGVGEAERSRRCRTDLRAHLQPRATGNPNGLFLPRSLRRARPTPPDGRLRMQGGGSGVLAVVVARSVKFNTPLNPTRNDNKGATISSAPALPRSGPVVHGSLLRALS